MTTPKSTRIDEDFPCEVNENELLISMKKDGELEDLAHVSILPIAIYHNFKSFPVGTGEAKFEGQLLSVKVSFLDGEGAEVVKRLFSEGFFKRVSLGFVYQPETPRAYAQKRLVQVSLVPPVNIVTVAHQLRDGGKISSAQLKALREIVGV